MILKLSLLKVNKKIQRSDFEMKCSEVEILQETVAEIKRGAAVEITEKIKDTEQLVKNEVCQPYY